MKATSKVEILVLTFDGFSDVWPIFFDRFYSNWPDCPFQINLLSNYLIYPDKRVRSLCIGEDKDWSTSVIKGLELIEADYILTIFDDLILKEKVDQAKIMKLVQLTLFEGYDYFRFRPYPSPDKINDEGYGKISQKAEYRVSLCTALIKKSVLGDLLKGGESAWDFELYGTLRSTKYNSFYATTKSLLPYYNAIEKGKWRKDFLQEMELYDIDVSTRGIYEESSTKSRLGGLKHWILFSLLPLWLRGKLLKLLNMK